METLTESGAMPVSHHPISSLGFFPKQDSAPYYFPNNSSLPRQPGNGTYPGFPQMSDDESWTNSQNLRNHVFPNHQRRNEEPRSEKSDNVGPYIPPTHSRSSPQHFSSSIHPQLHHPQRFAPSSLTPYQETYISPSSRERDQIEKKNSDVAINSTDPLNKVNDTLISEKLKMRLHNSSEHGNYSRREPSSLANDSIHLLQYTYNKNSVHGSYTNDNHRAMYYHRDFHETPQNVKSFYSSNSNGVISYSQPRRYSVTSDDEQTVDADDCQNNIVYTEFRERIVSSTLHKSTPAPKMTKESQIDQGRQQSLHIIPDHLTHRREIGHHLVKSEGKSLDCYKERDRTCHAVTNSQYFYEEKRTALTAEDIASSLRDKEGDNESFDLHSTQNNTIISSPESSHDDNVTSPQPHNRCHTPLNDTQSPIKHIIDYNCQSPTQNSPTLHCHTPEKLALFPPNEQKDKKETPPTSWMNPSRSPCLSQLKNPQKEDSSKNCHKTSQISKENIDVMKYEESLKPDGALNTQNMLTTSNKSLSQPHLSQEPELSPETPTKLSPLRRQSPDEFAKNSISEDGSFDAKREIFSDEGEDDSACEDSMAHSPTFSPFHDSSIPYSHPFPHPFFSSQAHGPLSGLRFQFGSLQGPHDRPLPGVGFPFRSMPGVPQDMSLISHMHSSRPPFVGSSQTSFGPVRQLSGESDIFFCHLCSYSGKSKSEFDVHMNTHFEFNCPHCDYTSRTEGRLKRHIKDFHSENSSRRSMPGRPKVYKCKQCQFSATEKDKFWAHSRTHIKEDKLLQCPKCPFVTEYKHHLEYHLRNHFGSKPFKCPKCNYSCVNKSMLNSHMKSHTNVYQYRCSECTYATKYCHSLKLHLKKYNHKPATVLNQDGSLPQGLDAGSSGLSIVSKRGPPRGPRATRKDSNGSYMSHLFEMPQMPLGVGGVNPLLNNMMPFWPLFPQAGIPGHPSPQTGILPEIRDLAQQIGIMADHRNISDHSKMDEEISENSSEECKNSISEKGEMCKFCNFTAESREALGLHLIRIHKEEAKEVIMSCGFSESFLAESFKNVNYDPKFEKQCIPEALRESDSEQDSGEFQCRNSNTGFQYKESSEFSQFKTDQKDDSFKTPPLSRSKSLYSENYNGGNQQHYDPVDSNSTSVDNKCSANKEIDILQQMTLKFGTGPVSDIKILSTKEEGQNKKKDNIKVSTMENIHHSLHYTALDLTKPKSVSPPITSTSPKYIDDDNDIGVNEDEEIRLSSTDQIRYLSEDLESSVKRPRTEVDDINNIPMIEMSSVTPRKRSRKGKAYKLDTLCMKLQKRQEIITQDDDLNLGYNFNHLKNIQAFEEDAQINSGMVHIDEPLNNLSIMHDTRTDMSGTTESKEGNRKDVFEYIKNDKKQSNIGNITLMRDENTEIKNYVITGNKQLLQDEAELELQKLQKSLSVFDQGLNSDLESANDDRDNKETQNKDTKNKNGQDDCSYLTEDNSSEATIEEETNLDDDIEGNSSAVMNTETSQKSTEEDEMDPAELINTVLENRKKPVPPEVRRGTELAWKLLNDPVNPVTTLPLPVNALNASPPLPSTSSVPSNTTTDQSVTNSSAAVRKDLKQHSSLPSHSHQSTATNLHHAHIPLPHHINIPQSHRPHIRHSQSFHSHTPQSIVAMKPIMSVPIPTTPMAYIPPTNRMISEPSLASPCSRMKPLQKELYECTYCDLSFRDCVMYTVHMGYHSNQNPFQCNSCGVVSRDKVEFFLHIARSPHA